MLVKRDPGTAVGRGAVKKLRAMETYKKTKKIVTNYACFCSTTVLTSKIIKEAYRKICFNLTLIYHEIIYDAAMKKTPVPRCPFFERSGGDGASLQRPCLPLSAVTVSLHYLPQMFAFSSLMQQNAYCRNLSSAR